MAKRNYKKRSNWTDASESSLVQLWGENIDRLRGNRKNSHIFEEMSASMKDFGYDFTSKEIIIKIHNLTSKYRMEKKIIGPSGGSPSTWPLYNRVHSIIGHHKSNKVEELMEDNLDIDANLSIEILDDSDAEIFLTGDCNEKSFCCGITEESVASITVKEENRKGKKRSFQQEILREIKESKELMKQDIEERCALDAKMLKLQEELVQLEREKIEIMKKMIG